MRIQILRKNIENESDTIQLSAHSKFSKWFPSRGSMLFTIVAIILLFVVQSAMASKKQQVTEIDASGSTGLVAYQGRLTDLEGKPLTGLYTMVFRLYSQADDGVPLWEEQRTGPNSVEISDGLFNVMLGSLVPIPQSIVTGNSELFLGVTVGNDDEMTPRVQIGSVLYARQALSVPDGSITAEKLADGAVPPGVPVGSVISWWRPSTDTPLPSDEWMIADGSVVTDSTSPLYGTNLPNLTNKFVMGVASEQVGITGGSNSQNLNHQHVVVSHTHTIPSHIHNSDGLYANVSVEDDRVYVERYGSGFPATNANYTGSSHVNTHITGASADVDGTTGAWGGTTGSSTPNTSASLSDTTDNRPEFIGLLYIVRIK